MKTIKTSAEPKAVFREFLEGNSYKSSIGRLGLFEQTKMNERFFIGDQWYGAQCGTTRPLARRNIIKRIGEYKMSSVGSAPVTVSYTADGIPTTADIKKQGKALRREMLSQGFTLPEGAPSAAEVSVITEALSRYQKITAERLKFSLKSEQLLRNAYISGTGIAYTYWDNDIDTGLYADDAKTRKIKGDIAFEILDVENVVFGDPSCDDVQSQPYIIISQRLEVETVRRKARLSGLDDSGILPDGQMQYDPDDNRKVTLLTKLYKQWSPDDRGFKIMAVQVTEKAMVRKPWDIGVSLYPIAVFCWERRQSSIYGDSEITYLIPNQIAINRMLTAECWSAMSVGMPKLLVNNDMISEDTRITNDPGQIIRANAGFEGSMEGAMRYVAPPNWEVQYQQAVNELCSGTLADAGANDAALGNLRPDNATAIIQLREAALQPMQTYRNRYYAFIEDVARIWADFWMNKYSHRAIAAKSKNGTEYLPFDADRYKCLPLTARVDVGASTLWSEAVVISTLDSLLKAGVITPKQYLERMPKGIIPEVAELIGEA